jgi:hypothetical protein
MVVLVDPVVLSAVHPRVRTGVPYGLRSDHTRKRHVAWVEVARRCHIGRRNGIGDGPKHQVVLKVGDDGALVERPVGRLDTMGVVAWNVCVRAIVMESR